MKDETISQIVLPTLDGAPFSAWRQSFDAIVHRHGAAHVREKMQQITAALEPIIGDAWKCPAVIESNAWRAEIPALVVIKPSPGLQAVLAALQAWDRKVRGLK